MKKLLSKLLSLLTLVVICCSLQQPVAFGQKPPQKPPMPKPAPICNCSSVQDCANLGVGCPKAYCETLGSQPSGTCVSATTASVVFRNTGAGYYLRPSRAFQSVASYPIGMTPVALVSGIPIQLAINSLGTSGALSAVNLSNENIATVNTLLPVGK